MSTYLLQTAGSTALAKALKATTLHIAIGRGDPAWDALTPEAIAASTPTNATALVDEIGRRVATAQFVEEDPAGDLEIVDTDADTTRRYRLSATPTPYLYLKARFDRTEGQGEYVREFAVFSAGQPIAGLPPGQVWFTAAEIATPGDLYGLTRIARKYRDGVENVLEETVLPF